VSTEQFYERFMVAGAACFLSAAFFALVWQLRLTWLMPVVIPLVVFSIVMAWVVVIHRFVESFRETWLPRSETKTDWRSESGPSEER
jgi:hypothetical protein